MCDRRPDSSTSSPVSRQPFLSRATCGGGQAVSASAPADEDEQAAVHVARLQAQPRGQLAHRLLLHLRAVGQSHDRADGRLGDGAGPRAREVRRLGRQPVVDDLVARKEVTHFAACRVPAVPVDDHLCLGRAASRCPAARPCARAPARRPYRQPRAPTTRRRNSGAAPPASRATAAVATWEGRGEGRRHLPENRAGQSPAQRALDTSEALDHLDLAGQHRVQRALSALVHRVLAGVEADDGAMTVSRERRVGFVSRHLTCMKVKGNPTG